MAVSKLNFEPGNLKFDKDYNYRTYTQNGPVVIDTTNNPTGFSRYKALKGFTLPFVSDGSGVTWAGWCVDINGRQNSTLNTLTTPGTYTIHAYWDESQQVAVVVIFGAQEPPAPPSGLSGLQDVEFISPGTNVSISGNTLTKNAGGTGWNAGAYNSVKVPANSAVEITWRATNLGVGRMVALCTSDVNVDFSDKEYAQSLGDNQSVQVYNSGTPAGLSPGITVTAGDYFRLARSTDGTISYAHSTDKATWTTYYTEPSADTQELFVAFLINTQGGSINECEIQII